MHSLIKTSKQILLAESGTPNFGCLMGMLAPQAIDKYLDVFRRIVNTSDLHENGFELEPHITVLYGFHLDFDARALADLCKSSFPIEAELTGISRFECPEYDVIKFDVASTGLVDLNRKIARRFSDSIEPSEYDYHPHMTVAYVKKGSEFNESAGDRLVGKILTFNSLLYSLPEKQGRIIVSK